jgi:hypothetical protein
MSKYQTPTAELLLTLQFHPIQSTAESQEVESTKATDELRAQYGHVQWSEIHPASTAISKVI